MKGIRKLIRGICLIGAIFILFAPLFVSAASTSDLQKRREELARQAQQARELAAQKKKEAAELQKIVSQIDSDINATQSKINSTQSQINKTNNEINDINNQIVQREKELAVEQENQNEALRSVYETVNKNTLEILAGSENLSEVVTYGEYLETLEIKIENTIAEIERLKNELAAKKTELEKKKNELEVSKKELQQQQTALSAQKQVKNELLTQTTTAMKQFQTTAKNAESEVSNIDALIRASIGSGAPMGYLYGKTVSAGQIIGYQGSTGFSTGTHVHLEVRIGNTNDGNINDYLNIGYGNTSNPSSNCQIGTSVDEINLNYGLLKPISSGRVTSCWGTGGYGGGDWAGRWHGGVDMASYTGAPIYASASGRVVYDGNLGGWGHAVVIYHGNGFWTLYGHMLVS